MTRASWGFEWRSASFARRVGRLIELYDRVLRKLFPKSSAHSSRKACASPFKPPRGPCHSWAASPYELGLPAFDYYNWPNLYPSMCEEKPISRTPRQRSRSRVSENPRPSRHCAQRTHRRTCPSPTGTRLRAPGRFLPRVAPPTKISHALERCRSGHSHPEAKPRRSTRSAC